MLITMDVWVTLSPRFFKLKNTILYQGGIRSNDLELRGRRRCH
jgi:hypothetical protein